MISVNRFSLESACIRPCDECAAGIADCVSMGMDCRECKEDDGRFVLCAVHLDMVIGCAAMNVDGCGSEEGFAVSHSDGSVLSDFDVPFDSDADEGARLARRFDNATISDDGSEIRIDARFRITRRVIEKLGAAPYVFPQFIEDSIVRFVRSDWGDTTRELRDLNRRVLREGDGIIFGSYFIGDIWDGTKELFNVLIVQHIDESRVGSIPTVVFSDEYEERLELIEKERN